MAVEEIHGATYLVFLPYVQTARGGLSWSSTPMHSFLTFGKAWVDTLGASSVDSMKNAPSLPAML